MLTSKHTDEVNAIALRGKLKLSPGTLNEYVRYHLTNSPKRLHNLNFF